MEKKDESDVPAMVEILESQWTKPMNTDPSDIVNLSTGTAAPPDVAKDLLEANRKGEEAYKEFERDRNLPGHTKDLHDAIPRMPSDDILQPERENNQDKTWKQRGCPES